VIIGVNDAKNRNPSQEAKNVVEMGFSMIAQIEEVK
jgi:hypothetical protein